MEEYYEEEDDQRERRRQLLNEWVCSLSQISSVQLQAAIQQIEQIIHLLQVAVEHVPSAPPKNTLISFQRAELGDQMNQLLQLRSEIAQLDEIPMKYERHQHIITFVSQSFMNQQEVGQLKCEGDE